MHWVVIPFRGIESAKSRLAGSLSDAARRHIARAMFQHVLNVSCTAVGAKRVMVVTPSGTAARMAKLSGASVLREQEPGLNEAVTRACSLLRSRGNSTATIVASDLPLIGPDHITMLTTRARMGCVGIARDKSGEGTNAVALPLGARFQFAFGEHSFFRHLRQRSPTLPVTIIRDRALAADVDIPEDLVLLDEPGSLATLPPVRNIAFGAAR